MANRTLFFVVFTFALCVSAFSQELRITEDRGGRIGDYQQRFEGLRHSKDRVVIEGMCASACTLVLHVVSANRICVTPQAELGFHSAWDHSDRGPIVNPEATAMMLKGYPRNIQNWIRARGGMRYAMKWLKGRELARMYKPCETPSSTFAEDQVPPIFVSPTDTHYIGG